MPKVTERKGAIKLADIPKEIKERLDKGEIASANLTEWLAVDHAVLLKNVLTNLKSEKYIDNCLKALDNLKQKSTMQCITAIGKTLLIETAKDNNNQLFDLLSEHTSDSVRCWAAYFVGLDEKLSVEQKLNNIRRFAADQHFGVREIAWMSLRQSIDDHLEEAIGILATWTTNEDRNLRRFASEATRPRGVWSKHIEKLKINPQLGLPILEPLKSDTEKYVQDSVANWLNDASKTRPDWVTQTCKRWITVSPTKETKKITDKALRSSLS